MATQSSQIQFKTAIDKYYKLKHNYKISIQKAVKKIRDNNLLTVTEKQDKFRELKGKCVICGKSGGTIFKQENDILIAQCGHTDSPCKLNIKLQRAKYEDISTEILNQNIIINDKKTEIILTKLNFLFGFSNETKTIELFNRFKSGLVEEVKNYQKINRKYFDIVENLSNKEEIKKLNFALFSLIQNMKDLIKNFDETGDNQFLKDAGELYVNHIVKTVQELQLLKYKLQYIYTENDDHHLIQEIYTPSEMQVIVPGTENKILAFTV